MNNQSIYPALAPRRGAAITMQILVFGGVTVIMLSGFMLWTYSALTFSLRGLHRAASFSIAEAGIEYYRWHLAHNKSDYQDGTGTPGPYVHPYYNRLGERFGTFTLDITPPPSGSTIVTVRSTGRVDADPTVQKIIQVKFGIPSFAKYAVATNNNMRFGEGTDIYGEIISNQGLRIDGTAHNLVQSARTTYNDPDHAGADEYAVHTHRDLPPSTATDNTFRPLEAPPNPLAERSDVFLAGRAVGVPAVNFVGLSQNLSDIRTIASTSGIYATSSGSYGFELVLNATGTYALYRVTALAPPPSGSCSNALGQTGWGTWSVQTETLVKSGPFPANGIFFFEDNLWVRGMINGARLTIGSGRFPDNSTTRTSIAVNQDLRYTNYDGTDVIQLIMQNNFNIGLFSSDTLRVDAALIAQNGRVGRYYYPSGCSPYHIRQKITSYGMIATNLRYGFAYTDGTGYQNRELVYDSNLLYGPPPESPQTSSQYVQVSWEEVR
ncbi:MAG: hypothetical protein Q7S84_03045 [bacterium]|nr:hypothetical protein [bacterium]